MTAAFGIAALIGAATAVVLALRNGGLRRELEAARRDAETYRLGLGEANQQTRDANARWQQTERALRREIEDLYADIDHADPSSRARIATAGLRRMLRAPSARDD